MVVAVPAPLPESDLATEFFSFSRVVEAVSRFDPVESAFVNAAFATEFCVPSSWLAATRLFWVATCAALATADADSAANGATIAAVVVAESDSTSTKDLATFASTGVAAFVVEAAFVAAEVKVVSTSVFAPCATSPDDAACVASLAFCTASFAFDMRTVLSFVTVEHGLVATFSAATVFVATLPLAAMRPAMIEASPPATLFAKAVKLEALEAAD
jgi:hypothetical protein